MADRSSLSSKTRLNKSGQLRQQNLPGDGLLVLQERYSSCEEEMRSESVSVVYLISHPFSGCGGWLVWFPDPSCVTSLT